MGKKEQAMYPRRENNFGEGLSQKKRRSSEPAGRFNRVKNRSPAKCSRKIGEGGSDCAERLSQKSCWKRKKTGMKGSENSFTKGGKQESKNTKAREEVIRKTPITDLLLSEKGVERGRNRRKRKNSQGGI